MSGRPQQWTQERVIDAICVYAERYGRPPAAADWSPALARAQGRPDRAERFKADGIYPYARTVTERFGSWNAAIEAAGFTPTRRGHRQREAG